MTEPSVSSRISTGALESVAFTVTVTVSMGKSDPGSLAESNSWWFPVSLALPENVTVCVLPVADVNVMKWLDVSPMMLVVACQSTLAANEVAMDVLKVHVNENQPLAAKSTSMVVGVQVMEASAELREASLGQWSGR